jgi:DNA-directed RNA polymerase alpha subunit
MKKEIKDQIILSTLLCFLDKEKRSTTMLEMSITGKTNKEIAKEFSLTTARVNDILDAAFKELDVTSRQFENFIRVFKNTQYIKMDPIFVLQALEAQNGESNKIQVDPHKELILQKPIDVLDVSVRVFNSLKNFQLWRDRIGMVKIDLQNLGDIIQYTESDFFKQRNFGEKQVNELAQALRQYGLEFKKEKQ